MLNTRRADPTRDEVTCPYNAAHVIVASRLGNHLIKCEKNYPNMDKAKCRFNCDHIVPKHCVGHHEALCPNRQTLERFTHKVGESMCPVKDVVPIHVAVPSCEEDWDSVPVSSPLEVIQETIVEKPVLRLLAVNGLTKSERKQFKLQEQARLRKLEEEKAYKDARKAQNDVKKSHKKEKPKVSTDTEVRLPKTSKIAAESSLSAQKENDIGQLTNQLHLQTLDDGESGFDQETYYENNYMGGYGMPSNAADKSLKSSYGYQEEECLGAYEGTGYDVEYYGGYSGGYNDGRYDNLSEEVEEEEGPQPRWMKVSKKGGKKGVAGCSDRGQTESKGAQQRLLQLKEAQRIQNIKNTEALKVKVTSNNNNEPSPFSPSCVSLPSPALENNFNSELDENGFFRIPITRGRGRKL